MAEERTPADAQTSDVAGVRLLENADFRLLLDLVAQKYDAVFEQGGLDRLQVVSILGRSLLDNPMSTYRTSDGDRLIHIATDTDAGGSPPI